VEALSYRRAKDFWPLGEVELVSEKGLEGSGYQAAGYKVCSR